MRSTPRLAWVLTALALACTQPPVADIGIPQAGGERCLNLSTAAGIALYHALREIQI